MSKQYTKQTTATKVALNRTFAIFATEISESTVYSEKVEQPLESQQSLRKDVEITSKSGLMTSNRS